MVFYDAVVCTGNTSGSRPPLICAQSLSFPISPHDTGLVVETLSVLGSYGLLWYLLPSGNAVDMGEVEPPGLLPANCPAGGLAEGLLLPDASSAPAEMGVHTSHCLLALRSPFSLAPPPSLQYSPKPRCHGVIYGPKTFLNSEFTPAALFKRY